MANILAIDDSASTLKILTSTLNLIGHQVTEASDGVDGLNKARDARFDLVLTDVNMPSMDGVSVVRELRNLSDYRFTPILMLTTGQDHKVEEKEAGATGWLSKPIDPEHLTATIKRVLG